MTTNRMTLPALLRLALLDAPTECQHLSSEGNIDLADGTLTMTCSDCDEVTNTASPCPTCRDGLVPVPSTSAFSMIHPSWTQCPTCQGLPWIFDN